MIPFLEGKGCKVIALCMDDAGMPNSADDILGRAKGLVEALNKIGIPTASTYVDPLDQKIMVTIRTADMLLSHDDFCMNYLKGVRAGAIVS